MRLREIDWNGGKGAEEVVIWGIQPIQEMLDILDEEICEGMDGMGNRRATVIYYQLKNRLADLEDYLMSIDDAAHDRKRTAGV